MEKDWKRTWDRIYRESGKVFLEPQEDLASLIPRLKKRKVRRVLDLGSGSGRHVVYLAAKGFLVSGIDISPLGVKMTRQALREAGLTADLRVRDMNRKLPYPDAFFDAVFSIQVIHHNRVAVIRKIIGEIERVLKKGGFIFITVPRSKRHAKEYEEIEPGTCIPLDGREKGLPHHYFTPQELRSFFPHFKIRALHVDRSNHYVLSGFKQGLGRESSWKRKPSNLSSRSEK